MDDIFREGTECRVAGLQHFSFGLPGRVPGGYDLIVPITIDRLTGVVPLAFQPQDRRSSEIGIEKMG